MAVLLIVCALATARGGDPRLYPAPPGEGVTVYLVDNGFHTDLAIPRAGLIADDGASARAADLTAAGPWMLVGWGDAEFYEGDGVSVNRVFEGLGALLGLRGRSVVHFLALNTPPDASWRETIRPLRLSNAGLAALVRRLDASFAPAPDGAVMVESVSREAGEQFFRSRERFSVLHLCNHWTGELLNAAGLPVTPAVDTLPAGLEVDLSVRARPALDSRRPAA